MLQLRPNPRLNVVPIDSLQDKVYVATISADKTAVEQS